jgi:hypothetical protein
MAPRDRWLVVVAVTVALAAGLAFARELLRAQDPGSGPAPLAWDREACTRCRMLISERRFAAQAREVDGTVRAFDDPGCLLLWRAETDRELAEVHFHHLDEDRWVPADEAVFVPVETTPMAYGLGVRDAGQGLGIEQALDRVRRLEARRDAGGEAPRVP